MARVDLPLSDSQREWLTLGLFIALFPVTYIMYRQWTNLRTRYPSVSSSGGVGRLKQS